jgi:hypothetical protein
MNRIEQQRLALRLAAAILIKHGEISSEDIRSLPFLTDDFDTRSILNALSRIYNVDITSLQTTTKPFLRWEEKVLLRAS